MFISKKELNRMLEEARYMGKREVHEEVDRERAFERIHERITRLDEAVERLAAQIKNNKEGV